MWISLLCFSFGSCSLSSCGRFSQWLLEWKYFFKLQRTVMNHKDKILLLKNKLRAVQMPPGYFRWWLLYVVVGAHRAVAFSSPFQDVVKKWSTVHSHKLLWFCRFLSLPLISPFLPPPSSPTAFVQPANPLLNPRELILGTGTIKKKRQIDLHFLSGRFTCKI